eukprot:8362979-Prorocentrum_lima.AAC.1
MTSSLVGSEMCIRDRVRRSRPPDLRGAIRERRCSTVATNSGGGSRRRTEPESVSYTHLRAHETR